MLKPPMRMSMPMLELTRSIRSLAEHNEPPSRYREFIQENIYSVIKHTFPLFCAQLNQQSLCTLADEWLVRHGATEPEFHQIASELLQFIQQHNGYHINMNLSAEQIALLEYEWIVFNAEMDTAHVLDFKVCWDDVAAQPQGFCLQLNPTLKLIEVPFVVHPESVTFFTHPQERVCYGVFRHATHQVVSQKLRDLDIALIQMIQSNPTCSVMQLEQQIAQSLANFHFLAWVQSFDWKGLISLRLLGETQ
ncbi:HvfC family peptide modification chaperone [Vibrio cholerae]|uniref:DUF2063 domain-containing protein n=1 Tax=Vibrio cholerae TaxID=666 RepID=A0A395U7Q0_VIBCL|nr:putative DNA-binding domain-containing protein [Vibrio cholerae]AYC04625.1 hypothetical protein FORC73_0637 [Vibrio cholerae]EGQ7702860.1 DUF2063 domain-containing protein [Vibrio cholerae]EGQ7789190.1 DUF2063 domain-containing protein [Vibrio cholerae]EGQ9500302.1 DUF2063 domain-containing protein [Vibrio cholerae]EGR0485945.1 DUF2063 domain-containing protein [Vibrio cholerae]